MQLNNSGMEEENMGLYDSLCWFLLCVGLCLLGLLVVGVGLTQLRGWANRVGFSSCSVLCFRGF